MLWIVTNNNDKLWRNEIVECPLLALSSEEKKAKTVRVMYTLCTQTLNLATFKWFHVFAFHEGTLHVKLDALLNKPHAFEAKLNILQIKTSFSRIELETIQKILEYFLLKETFMAFSEVLIHLLNKRTHSLKFY